MELKALKLPQEQKEYQWIADRFAAISGVELIAIHSQDSGREINLMMTNNRKGKDIRVFTLPLKTNIIIDYVAAEDCNHEYDVNTYPDIELILIGALAKAEVLFGNVRPN
jgi:hypothetical protein